MEVTAPIAEYEIFAYFASEVVQIADAICKVDETTMRKRFDNYLVREDVVSGRNFDQHLLPEGRQIQDFLKRLVQNNNGLIVHTS